MEAEGSDYVILPCDAANALPFRKLCERLEKARSVKDKRKKFNLIFSEGLNRMLTLEQSVYPIMRLIDPLRDRKRIYGLKATALGKLYIKALAISENSTNAQQLSKWTEAKFGRQGSNTYSDFAQIAYNVLEPRLKINDDEREQKQAAAGRGDNAISGITIGELNRRLDALSSCEGASDQRAIIAGFTKDMSAVENMWAIRIILKDLNIGLSADSILKNYHPDAVDNYNIYSDLQKVCDMCRDPAVRSVPRAAPNDLLAPMLAARATDAKGILKCMKGVDFLVEPKFDGERVLIHKVGNSIKLTTRNRYDVTERYGPTLREYILKATKKAHTCVLDGELMSWNDEEKRFLAFGVNKTVARMQAAGASKGAGSGGSEGEADGVADLGDSASQWMCYVAFDLIYLESKDLPDMHGSLTGYSLERRRRCLHAILEPIENRLQLAEPLVTCLSSWSEDRRRDSTFAALDAVISAQGEGVMVKNLESSYIFGHKSKLEKKWLKLKPDYVDEIGDTVDAIVLGGYYGEGGRRGGDLSSFLLGVIDGNCSSAAEALTKQFYTFTKVGTGYSMAQLKELRDTLRPVSHKWNPDILPPHFKRWKPRKDIAPHFWYKPEDSIILEIKFSEFQASDIVTANRTARFPRVVRIRDDKEWFECNSYADLEAMERRGLFKSGSGAVAAASQGTVDGSSQLSSYPSQEARSVVGKKRKRSGADNRGGTASKRAATNTVLNAYTVLSFDASGVKENLFKGWRLVVTQGIFALAGGRDGIQRLLHELGAKRDANPGLETKYIIADRDAKLSLKVKNQMDAKRHDVIHYEWVMACKEEGVLLFPPEKRYFMSMTADTEAFYMERADEFGDSYTDLITAADLFKLCDSMKPDAMPEAVDWVAEVRGDRHTWEHAFTMFHGFVFYIDQFDPLGSNIRIKNSPAAWSSSYFAAEQWVRLHGGSLAGTLDESVTHVLVDARDVTRVEGIRNRLRASMALRPRISMARLLNLEWVERCVVEKRVASYHDFILHVE